MAWPWIVSGIALLLAAQPVKEPSRRLTPVGATSCEAGERSETMDAASKHTMIDGAFRDESRDRTVPYRLYAPALLAGVCPVVLVSHGVGGSREAMPYLGRRLAQSGYVALHLQHSGTDNSVWQRANSLLDVYRALREAMWDANAARARFQDVPFVVRELARLNREGPLAGHLDLTRIGMAGHSYGGVSTMVAAGQRMGPGGQWFFKEPRIRAGLVMSPNIPIQGGDLAALYRDIRIPLFHITGTNDGNAVPGNKEFDPIQRTLPYEELAIPHQYLLVLDGAGHNAFSGLEHGPHPHGAEKQTRYTRAVQEGAVLFFDAYLKGNAAALAALRDTFQSSLEPNDRFEWK
jgi:predicted dienelactone hydrolase